MKPFTIYLLVEWPILVVTMALMAWGMEAFLDAIRFDDLSGTPKGAESGAYGFNYGTQVVQALSTRTLTLSSPSPTTVTLPTTLTYSLYPYALGTMRYSSFYSRLGYLPTPVSDFTSTTVVVTDTYLTPASVRTSTRNIPAPTYTPPTIINRRRSAAAGWANNAGDGYFGLYSVGSDTRSMLNVLLLLFALVVAALAVRILFTPLFVWLLTSHTIRTRRHALAWHVAITVVMFLMITVPGLYGLIVFGYWYKELLQVSPAAKATMAFFAVAVLTTLVALAWSCFLLHKTIGAHKREQRQTESATAIHDEKK